MKKLSRLLLVLGLMLCISLTAYAEDAPAAQPTAKEPRTLTARTGTETCGLRCYVHHACAGGHQQAYPQQRRRSRSPSRSRLSGAASFDLLAAAHP